MDLRSARAPAKELTESVHVAQQYLYNYTQPEKLWNILNSAQIDGQAQVGDLPFECEEADTNRVGDAVDTAVANHGLKTNTPEGSGKPDILLVSYYRRDYKQTAVTNQPC